MTKLDNFLVAKGLSDISRGEVPNTLNTREVTL